WRRGGFADLQRVAVVECVHHAFDGPAWRRGLFYRDLGRADVRLSLEDSGFPLARHLGRKPQPDPCALEWQYARARHGVRGLTHARDATGHDRSGQSVRRARVPLATREVAYRGAIPGFFAARLIRPFSIMGNRFFDSGFGPGPELFPGD